MKVFHCGRHRGVFVCGPHPLWLMEQRQRLRAHPHEGDGPITAFAPLHNKHCPHGFIVTTGGGALKVGRLPPDVQFDNDWPLLKVPQQHRSQRPGSPSPPPGRLQIPLRATPHLIALTAPEGADSPLYVLLSSQPVSTRHSALH